MSGKGVLFLRATSILRVCDPPRVSEDLNEAPYGLKDPVITSVRYRISLMGLDDMIELNKLRRQKTR